MVVGPFPDGFVVEPDTEGEFLEIANLFGIPWHEAELPWRFHFCAPQTIGWDFLTRIQRCACGAIQRNSGQWIEKNSRRKKS